MERADGGRSMNVKPYRRPPERAELGFLTEAGRVLTEDGRNPMLGHADKRLLIFADREMVEAKHLIRGEGFGVCWNERVIRWEHLGRRVQLLTDANGEPPEVFAGLLALRDYLGSRGAGIPSTLGSASMSLLRATIDQPLYFPSGDVPRLGEFIGGRVQSFAGGYVGGFGSWDIQAAYTRTMGELCYNGRWKVWNRPPSDASPFPCYYRATVTSPGRLGLVPRRARKRPAGAGVEAEIMRDYPTGVRFSGIWNRAELDAAAALGARVKVRKVWLGAGPLVYPFAPWWEAVKEARALPGWGGVFGKAMGNTLWSRFALTGEGSSVTYKGGWPTRRTTRKAPAHLSALDLTELITSTTRARLLSDMMGPYGPRLLAVHTDGALLAPGPEPELPAYWRRKAAGDRLILIDPGTYSYRNTETDRTEYVVSGVPARHAREVFRSRLAAAYPERGRSFVHGAVA